MSYLCRDFKKTFIEIKKDAANKKETRHYATQELFLNQRLREIQEPAATAISIEDVFAQTTECFKKKETPKG